MARNKTHTPKVLGNALRNFELEERELDQTNPWDEFLTRLRDQEYAPHDPAGFISAAILPSLWKGYVFASSFLWLTGHVFG